MIPNIFEIATKELHQDAFLTWLLMWGDPSNKKYDNDLHICSQEFISHLIGQQNSLQITKIDAGRQWNNIDIWAEVFTPKNNYFIIIEDKTFTTERTNQLKTYKKIAEEYSANNNFKLICVYIKTGSEPENVLKKIRDQGFTTFNRDSFLILFEKYKNISNNIFIDFHNRIISLEASYNAYNSTLIEKWNDHCWIGFYQFLEREIGLVLWHYVNPPSGGGFWNACLNWEYWNGFPVYLQIEQGNLCFKIATHPDELDFELDIERGIVRNNWHDIIIRNSEKLGYTKIRRPQRFGNGNYMTCALVSKNDWLGENNSLIDKANIIDKLKHYIKFLNECLKDEAKRII